MIFLRKTLSSLYAAAVEHRAQRYEKNPNLTVSLVGKVISIGNLELGGTGKTPLTIAIAKRLLAARAQPAILTRGYRSGLGAHDSMALMDEQIIMPPLSPGSYHPDEAWLEASCLRTVPVIVGAKRFAAAQRYLQQHSAPTHWLLDDGFQHLQLKRDLNLVLLSADLNDESAQVVPLGRLRESLTALSRADGIILTRGEGNTICTSVAETLEKLHVPILNVGFTQREPWLVLGDRSLPWQTHQRWLVISAIAKPDRLLSDLKHQGLKITRTLLLRDHSLIPPSTSPYDDIDAIITTAKDWFRDPKVFATYGKNVYLTDVVPNIADRELDSLLAEMLSTT